MPRGLLVAVMLAACAIPPAVGDDAPRGTREFRVADGGKLTLDLSTGGSVKIAGTGGTSVTVSYKLSCTPECAIAFEPAGNDLKVRTRFATSKGSQTADVDLDIRVPARFDVALDSMGGSLEIEGVKGTFSGETKGGEITLRHVDGEAKLRTMGGEIRATDSTLDGSLNTMGGDVTIENVVGNVKGNSMGGDIRYENVRHKDGAVASPPRSDGSSPADVSPETVQISTMGGEIRTEDAPDGADVMTMGGEITIKSARRFVRAKTMGGDIEIGAVDGWVEATTMGGDIDVNVTGGGGDVTLVSMGGDIGLRVPKGFGMTLDLEIAFTKDSHDRYEITAPGTAPSSVTPDWDRSQGSPRKYIRKAGSINGGGHTIKVKTINGNIKVTEGS